MFQVLRYLLVVSVLLTLLPINSAAFSLNSYDPRSMGMGGVGIAVPGVATAPLFNPALLSTAISGQGKFITIPTVGMRTQNSDDFFDSIEKFQDNDIVGNLADNIDRINELDYNNNIDEYISQLSTILDNTIVLESAVNDLSNMVMSADIGGALIAGSPSNDIGFSFMVNGIAAVAGIVNYTPNDKRDIQSLLADFQVLESCLSEDPESCLNEDFIWYDHTNNEITYNPNFDLNSNVVVRAIIASETGLSLSHLFEVNGYPIAAGITPKYVTATVIDYEENIETADKDDSDSNDYMKDYNDFNLDVGATIDLQNGLYVGLVVKNIIPKEYKTYNRICRGNDTPKSDGYCRKTATGNAIDIDPQLRVGVSKVTDLYTLAADLDITENGLINLDEGSRYLGFGGELNSLEWLSLRLGYRFDLVNSDHNVASIGVGLSQSWFKLDLAVSGKGSDELGASAQLSLQF
ncbi:MAG: conjugal transfer protein TraF [Candidatus Thiodiazotropha sp.]